MDDANEELCQIMQSIKEQFGDRIKRLILRLNVTTGNAFRIFLRIAQR